MSKKGWGAPRVPWLDSLCSTATSLGTFVRKGIGSFPPAKAHWAVEGWPPSCCATLKLLLSFSGPQTPRVWGSNLDDPEDTLGLRVSGRQRSQSKLDGCVQGGLGHLRPCQLLGTLAQISSLHTIGLSVLDSSTTPGPRGKGGPDFPWCEFPFPFICGIASREGEGLAAFHGLNPCLQNDGNHTITLCLCALERPLLWVSWSR